MDVEVPDDDQLGLTPGGNKTRKLEFLVADALAHPFWWRDATRLEFLNAVSDRVEMEDREGVGGALLLAELEKDQVLLYHMLMKSSWLFE